MHGMCTLMRNLVCCLCQACLLWSNHGKLAMLLEFTAGRLLPQHCLNPNKCLEIRSNPHVFIDCCPTRLHKLFLAECISGWTGNETYMYKTWHHWVPHSTVQIRKGLRCLTPVLSSQDVWWVTSGSTPQTVSHSTNETCVCAGASLLLRANHHLGFAASWMPAGRLHQASYLQACTTCAHQASRYDIKHHSSDTVLTQYLHSSYTVIMVSWIT